MCVLAYKHTYIHCTHTHASTSAHTQTNTLTYTGTVRTRMHAQLHIRSHTIDTFVRKKYMNKDYLLYLHTEASSQGIRTHTFNKIALLIVNVNSCFFLVTKGNPFQRRSPFAEQWRKRRNYVFFFFFKDFVCRIANSIRIPVCKNCLTCRASPYKLAPSYEASPCSTTDQPNGLNSAFTFGGQCSLQTFF